MADVGVGVALLVGAAVVVMAAGSCDGVSAAVPAEDTCRQDEAAAVCSGRWNALVSQDKTSRRLYQTEYPTVRQVSKDMERAEQRIRLQAGPPS